MKWLIPLLFATVVYAEEPELSYKVDTELVCYQNREETICKIEELHRIPPVKHSTAPKAYVAPLIVAPVVRYIIVKVGEAIVVDLAKDAIIKQYKELFPGKPLPVKISLQKAH